MRSVPREPRTARAVPKIAPIAAVVHAKSATTQRVSVDSNGTEANDDSSTPAISADGRFVAFSSAASNLVGGDTNGFQDIFIRDRLLLTTERVSFAFDGAPAPAIERYRELQGFHPPPSSQAKTA